MLNLITATCIGTMFLTCVYLRGVSGLAALFFSFVLGFLAGYLHSKNAHLKAHVYRFSHLCSSLFSLAAAILLLFRLDSWSLDLSLGCGIFASILFSLAFQQARSTDSDATCDAPICVSAINKA